MTAFLDTNVILRHLLHDVPDQSLRSTEFLRRVLASEVTVLTSDLVIFEVVYVLERSLRRQRAEIRDALLPIIEAPSLRLPGKLRYTEVFALYVDRNISFPDAFHAVLARTAGVEEVVSFDRDFDRVPWLRRIEP